MKKILLFLFIILPVYIFSSIYFLDKDDFLCPIGYKGNIIVRCDSRGNGFFASPRNGNRLHEGLDFLAEVSTPVLAARSGKVIAATANRGMGNYIIIRHADNIITIYGHLSAILVAKDEYARQGQVIGRVGKTGNANYSNIQPHLHFEVRKDGISQDPLGYLQ